MSKQPTDDLFQLISSLNGSEKRYFKIFSGRHTIGEQNNYPLLFDALSEVKHYDEKEFIKQHPELTRSYFADQKQKLYELILRSNVIFHFKASVDLELYHQLSAIQLLFKKGLFTQCKKLLAKTRKKALHFERFAILLELFGIEKQLVFAQFHLKRTKKETREIDTETQRVLELYSNASAYRLIAEEMYLILSEERFLRDKKNKERVALLMEKKIMKEPRLALSVDAQFSYHRARGFYCYMTDDPKGFYFHNSEILALINTYPHLVNNPTRAKITAYQNILIGLKNMGEFAKAMRMMKEFKALPTESQDQRVELFSVSTDIELTFYIDTGNFSEGSGVETKLRKDLDAFGTHMREHTLAIIYFNMAYILTGAGKFKQAVKWINSIISDKRIESPPDTFSMAKLLSLLIYFELGDIDHIEYCLRPTSNFLVRNEKFHVLEKSLLKFFHKVIDPEERKKMKELYGQLTKELQKIAQHPSHRNAFNYFDFLSWAKSKVESVTMEEVVKRERGK